MATQITDYFRRAYNQSSQRLPVKIDKMAAVPASLIMDDKSGEEKISLANKENKNQLLLDATENAHQASLKSVEGDVQFQPREPSVCC